MKKTVYLLIVAGFLFGVSGCFEKDEFPKTPSKKQAPADPFGLFNIYLTLFDLETKEPLPDLLIKLSNITSSRMNDPETVDRQVSDTLGFVHITIAAAPPIPQEFVLSVADTTKIRSFQQQYISVRFIDPIFKYIQKDAAEWGNMYQGTAELTLTRELKQIDYE